MPCPFTGPKMVWAGPNFLCQTKNLFTYCGSHKLFVPDKKMISIQYNWFCLGTKVFEEALNAVKFLGCLKKFGPAQNILGPVKRTRHSFDIHYRQESGVICFIIQPLCHKTAGNGSKLTVMIITVSF